MNRLLTAREAAGELKVSVRTLRQRIYDGELPAGKEGNRIRIRQSDLDRYIQTQVMR